MKMVSNLFLDNSPRSPRRLLMLNRLYSRWCLLFKSDFKHSRRVCLVWWPVKTSRRDHTASSRVHVLKYARVISSSVSVIDQRAWRGCYRWRPSHSLLNQWTWALITRLVVCQVLVQTSLWRHCHGWRCGRWRLLVRNNRRHRGIITTTAITAICCWQLDTRYCSWR